MTSYILVPKNTVTWLCTHKSGYCPDMICRGKYKKYTRQEWIVDFSNITYYWANHTNYVRISLDVPCEILVPYIFVGSILRDYKSCINVYGFILKENKCVGPLDKSQLVS